MVRFIGKGYPLSVWKYIWVYYKKLHSLGGNMQNVRKCRKMKRQELADAIGINMQSLSKIEKGETVRPLTCWKK